MTTPMRAPDYLRSLDTETIRRAYERAGEGFTRKGDAAAAQALEAFAALGGLEVQINPTTLGRERSSRGIVAFKSPRGAAASDTPPAVVAQPELPGVHDDGAARAGWATERKVSRAVELLEEIRTMLAGAIGRGVIARGKASVEPEPRPLAVGGAA